MKWHVELELTSPRVDEAEDPESEVMFGLPWTDVVGPEGDITVSHAYPVEEE